MTTPTIEWQYEYLPFTTTEDDGTEREIPNYRIFPDDDSAECYIAETNENLPGEVQEAHALLISAAPKLHDALEYFFNIMHDVESSRRKGYIKHAMDQARAALAVAKGRSNI